MKENKTVNGVLREIHSKNGHEHTYVSLPSGESVYYNFSGEQTSQIHLFSCSTQGDERGEEKSLCGNYSSSALNPLCMDCPSYIESKSHVCYNCVQSLRRRDAGAVRDLQHIVRNNGTRSPSDK